MANNKVGKYSREMVAEAQRLHVDEGMTLESISGLSADLLGMHVPFNTLNQWSRNNGWASKAAIVPEVNQPSIEGDVGAEVETIRRIIFREIEAKSHLGILVYGPNLAAAKAILEGYDGITVVDVTPQGVDSQSVNAYMNLLVKSKLDIQNIGKSAKTSRQQAIELIRQQRREGNEGSE